MYQAPVCVVHMSGSLLVLADNRLTFGSAQFINTRWAADYGMVSKGGEGGGEGEGARKGLGRGV